MYGTACDLTLHFVVVLGSNTRETTLFNYFNESWESYNNFTDFEPVFLPDPDSVPDNVKDACGGMYIILW